MMRAPLASSRPRPGLRIGLLIALLTVLAAGECHGPGRMSPESQNGGSNSGGTNSGGTNSGGGMGGGGGY